jgi:hypothetical protein
MKKFSEIKRSETKEPSIRVAWKDIDKNMLEIFQEFFGKYYSILKLGNDSYTLVSNSQWTGVAEEGCIFCSERQCYLRVSWSDKDFEGIDVSVFIGQKYRGGEIESPRKFLKELEECVKKLDELIAKMNSPERRGINVTKNTGIS